MSVNLKPYVYKKGINPALDAQFSSAGKYGWVKAGQTAVFWKNGLRWHVISLSEADRIFRRVVPVDAKLCCGRQSFIMEYLVIIRKDGSELELYIGDDMEKKAAALLDFLKQSHPELTFGKP